MTQLLLTTSPFLKAEHDTRWIMWQVNLALLPLVLAAVYFFGVSALFVIAACTAGAVLPEWLQNRSTVTDGSAIITGVLLALTLPPSIPLWMAFIGGSLAILLGKILFGGLGSSVFNPALVGRAFLQAAFPEAMTTWTTPQQGLFAVSPRLFALPFLRPEADALSSATPLAQMKFEGLGTPLPDLFFGTTSGSLGETAGILILFAGGYLAVRGVLNWRIPLGIFVSTFALASLLHTLDPAAYPPALFHLFAGGLVLGAVFMATDPVTSPNSQIGCWVFAFGIGVLVVVIRTYGGLPEGVMYSILLMNGLTPLINRATQPRIFGTARRAWWKA